MEAAEFPANGDSIDGAIASAPAALIPVELLSDFAEELEGLVSEVLTLGCGSKRRSQTSGSAVGMPRSPSRKRHALLP